MALLDELAYQGYPQMGRRRAMPNRDVEMNQGLLRGASYYPTDLLGAPVDLINMALKPMGLGSQKPVMGSDYLQSLAQQYGLSQQPTGSNAENVARLAMAGMNPASGARAVGRAIEPTMQALAPKAGQMAEDYLRSIGGILDISPTGRAKSGGEIADANGYFYKGGQFLPNTDAEPGKWKVGNKWVKSGRELIEPGVIANAPTPFSRSILSPLREYVDYVDNDFKKLKLKEGMKVLGKTGDDGLQHYEPVTAETTWTPRLADYEHHTPVTIGELIDAYNNGQRWFDVKPDALTITKSVVE